MRTVIPKYILVRRHVRNTTERGDVVHSSNNMDYLCSLKRKYNEGHMGHNYNHWVINREKY